MEETFENERINFHGYADIGWTLGRHRCTMKLKVYINRHENGRKMRKGGHNMWMNFSPTCRQKPECQCSTTIYCQHNSIFHRQKKLLFVYLTSQNCGLSGLKNMWPVIMTGDLLSVILNIVSEIRDWKYSTEFDEEQNILTCYKTNAFNDFSGYCMCSIWCFQERSASI